MQAIKFPLRSIGALLHRASAWLLLAAWLLAAPAMATEDLRQWRGAVTPPLELKDLSGNSHRLQDYRGKVVLINFWATWCEPCREEMPSIQQLKQKLAGKPFVVLAVNAGEFPARIESFLQKVPLDATVLRDHSKAVMKAWRVKVLPASFVVGPDGRVRYSSIGAMDWADDGVVRKVTALMQSQ